MFETKMKINGYNEQYCACCNLRGDFFSGNNLKCLIYGPLEPNITGPYLRHKNCLLAQKEFVTRLLSDLNSAYTYYNENQHDTLRDELLNQIENEDKNLKKLESHLKNLSVIEQINKISSEINEIKKELPCLPNGSFTLKEIYLSRIEKLEKEMETFKCLLQG